MSGDWMIIGITGVQGAGKSTIVEFLKEKGFNYYSMREFLNDEIRKRGLEINRDNMVMVANELRAEHHSGYIAEQLYLKARKESKDAVIESLRAVGEVQTLRKKGDFVLFAVDADQKTRYHRVTKRGTETDNITFEKFKKDEEREAANTDLNKQNIRACIMLADYRFENNGTIEDLNKKVESVLDGIRKQKAVVG